MLIDYVTLIKWKQGPNPSAPNNEALSGLKVAELRELVWLDKYEAVESIFSSGWTDEDETELERLHAGEVATL